MALFDALKEMYHRCTMDNFYDSASFFRSAYNHKNKVMCQGVTRKGMCGIPPSAVQEEKRGDYRISVCGTVKAAVLEGDPVCPELVASIVYDTNPARYLGMVREELKWQVNEKDVFDVGTGKTETIRFLRMNIIHDYNMTMGSVDIADQLRGNYRIAIGE